MRTIEATFYNRELPSASYLDRINNNQGAAQRVYILVSIEQVRALSQSTVLADTEYIEQYLPENHYVQRNSTQCQVRIKANY